MSGYKKRLEDLNLTIMSETLVDPDLAMSKREVLNETSINIGGKEHTIVRYKQVLQSMIDPGSKTRNWNGRGYMMDRVLKALDTNPIIQHEIGLGTWLAEYGHPYEPNKEAALSRQNLIEPKYICNKILRYWTEGNLLMSECETLAESWGAVLAARILTNLPAMASLRSVGRTDSNGIVMSEGFWIITYDTVVRPSHKEAMQTSKGQVIAMPSGNTMNESTMHVTLDSELARNFIISESAKDVEMICTLGNFNADTIQVEGNNITIKRISPDGLQLETVFIPIKTLVGSSYHELFK